MSEPDAPRDPSRRTDESRDGSHSATPLPADPPVGFGAPHQVARRGFFRRHLELLVSLVLVITSLTAVLVGSRGAPQLSEEPTCVATSRDGDLVTAVPNKGFSLRFRLDPSCDESETELQLVPSEGVAVVRLPRSEWLVSVPAGDYRYALIVPERGVTRGEPREWTSIQGRIVASADRAVLAAYDTMQRAIDHLQLEPEIADRKVKAASTARVSYAVAPEALRSSALVEGLGVLEVCPRFSLPLEQEPVCQSQSVPIAAPRLSPSAWSVSPTRAGTLTAILHLKLSMSVDDRPVEVFAPKEVSFGRAEESLGQRLQRYGGALVSFAVNYWPALVALFGAAGLGGFLIKVVRWWRRRRAPSAQATAATTSSQASATPIAPEAGVPEERQPQAP